MLLGTLFNWTVRSHCIVEKAQSISLTYSYLKMEAI